MTNILKYPHNYNEGKTMCSGSLIHHGELHLLVKIKIINR
jgi:hypothetical protein